MNSRPELRCIQTGVRRIVSYLVIATFLFHFVTTAAALPLEENIFQDPVSGQTVGVVASLRSLYRNPAPGGVASLAAEDAEQVALAAMKEYSSQIGVISPEKQLRRQKTEIDDLGVTHVQFQQVMDQVPVFGSKIIVHLNPARDSVLINGRVSQRNVETLKPSLSPEDALQRAEVEWRRQYSSEPNLKGIPTLFVLDTGLLEDLSSGNVYLTFQVDLGANNQAFRYFIDAATGVVVYRIPLSTSATKRLVYDCSYGDGACYLDSYSGFWGYTFGRSEGQLSRGANPINLSLIQAYPNETDRLYVMLGSAHDYFGVTFNRNGANGVGGLGDGSSYPIDTIPAVSYADYKLPGIGCPNANFNQMLSSLEFCAGLMLVDTVGHEFTHAVVHYTADLIYQGQSGALNESFADIFGEAVERYASGSHDWLLGASSRLGTLRSMSQVLSSTTLIMGPTLTEVSRTVSTAPYISVAQLMPVESILIRECSTMRHTLWRWEGHLTVAPFLAWGRLKWSKLCIVL